MAFVIVAIAVYAVAQSFAITIPGQGIWAGIQNFFSNLAGGSTVTVNGAAPLIPATGFDVVAADAT